MMFNSKMSGTAGGKELQETQRKVGQSRAKLQSDIHLLQGLGRVTLPFPFPEPRLLQAPADELSAWRRPRLRLWQQRFLSAFMRMGTELEVQRQWVAWLFRSQKS